MIHLSKVVVYIRKVNPDYLKPSNQGATKLTETVERLPKCINGTINKIERYLEENKITKEQLFELMDDTGDGFVEEHEMINFFTVVRPVRGINIPQVKELY